MEPLDQGKEFADAIDSAILLYILKEDGERLDQADIPLMGRYYWDFREQKIKRFDDSVFRNEP